jgi:hypothetical protein
MKHIDEAAYLIAKKIAETEHRICLENIDKVGLLHEFRKFIKDENILTTEIFREFAMLHPDKLCIPKQNDSYEEFVIMTRDE